MAVVDRALAARINARAETIRLLPVLLSLLALPFVAVGWSTFWIRRGFVVTARWVGAAVVVGYQMAQENHGRAG